MNNARILQSEIKITKLKEKLERIQNALAGGKNPYYYSERDLRVTLKDIESAENNLKKLIARESREKEINDNQVEVIERFLLEVKAKNIVHFTELVEKSMQEQRDFEKSIEGKVYANWGDEVDESNKFYNAQIGKYGGSVFNLIRDYPTTYKAEIAKEMEQNRKKQRRIFYRRVTFIVGKILDAKGLTIGSNGEINGLVIGDKGKATVNTISAGGYNVQCFHYRVLVKKLKEID